MSKRKLTRNEKRLKRFEPLIDKLPEDIKSRSLFTTTKGEAKLSAVLLDFLDPEIEDWETEDELRKLIGFGIVAWNAALLPPEEMKIEISTALSGLPLDTRIALKSVLDMLIRRKREYYADDRRLVLEYHLSMTRNGPHLSVVSSLTSSESWGS